MILISFFEQLHDRVYDKELLILAFIKEVSLTINHFSECFLRYILKFFKCVPDFWLQNSEKQLDENLDNTIKNINLSFKVLKIIASLSKNSICFLEKFGEFTIHNGLLNFIDFLIGALTEWKIAQTNIYDEQDFFKKK